MTWLKSGLVPIMVVAFGALGGAVSACGDPVPPDPKGALAVYFNSQTGGSSCQIAAGQARTYGASAQELDCSIPGNPAGDRKNDGDKSSVTGNDNTINCSVKKGGSGYQVSVSFAVDNIIFSMSGELAATGAGTLLTSANIVGQSSGSKPVVDQACAVTPCEIGAGKLWASFSCANMVDPPSESCVGTGTIVLENCDK